MSDQLVIVRFKTCCCVTNDFIGINVKMTYSHSISGARSEADKADDKTHLLIIYFY